MIKLYFILLTILGFIGFASAWIEGRALDPHDRLLYSMFVINGLMYASLFNKLEDIYNGLAKRRVEEGLREIKLFGHWHKNLEDARSTIKAKSAEACVFAGSTRAEECPDRDPRSTN